MKSGDSQVEQGRGRGDAGEVKAFSSWREGRLWSGSERGRGVGA